MPGRGRHRGRVLIAVVLACAWLCGCTGGGGGPVAITVSPGTALFDQPVKVSIRGLPARAVTTVTATARDAAGVTWSASADFRASDGGAMSLDQATTGGAYTGANPMGLFEFMAPDAWDCSSSWLPTPPTSSASPRRRPGPMPSRCRRR